MIWERVTFRRPKPPTDYSRDVQARWNAIRVLYQAQRIRERHSSAKN